MVLPQGAVSWAACFVKGRLSTNSRIPWPLTAARQLTQKLADMPGARADCNFRSNSTMTEGAETSISLSVSYGIINAFFSLPKEHLPLQNTIRLQAEKVTPPPPEVCVSRARVRDWKGQGPPAAHPSWGQIAWLSSLQPFTQSRSSSDPRSLLAIFNVPMYPSFPAAALWQGGHRSRPVPPASLQPRPVVHV